MTYRTIFKTLATLTFALAAQGLAQNAPTWRDALDAYVSEQIASTDLAAATVAVVSADEVLYARGFGETSLGSGTPVGPDTSFEIGSLTKSMTALAVLRLHEEGALDIDAPVQTYLPWFRVADEEASGTITLRHLLAHTSGLTTVSHGVVWQDYERIDPSIEEGVRALADVELATQPGEAFQYANMNYSTLGAVIEEVTGEPWDRHIERTLFEPLGMQDSAASPEARDGLEVAQAYTWQMGQRVPVPALGVFSAPAGSLNVSSGMDMAAYLQAWLSPSADGVVTPATVEEAFRAHAPVGNGEDIGMGWFLGERHGERLVYHSGGTSGATTYMALLPERGLGLMLLTNSQSSPAPAIGRGMVDVVLGETPAAVTTDTGRMTSYVLTWIAAVGLVLLALLGWRVVTVARGNAVIRRGWVHAIRTIVVGAVTVGLWVIVPSLLTSAGIPAPFGIRGFPFDILLATVALLGVPTAWAVYLLARWVGSMWGSRSVGRRTGPRAAASAS